MKETKKSVMIASLTANSIKPEHNKNALVQCSEFLSQLDEDLFRFIYVSPMLYGGVSVEIEKGVLNITVEFEENHFNWMVVDDTEWFSEKETPYGTGAFNEIIQIINKKLCEYSN